MHYGIIAYIGYMFSAFSFVASESVIEDTKKKWVLFLKSTPVTPCKLATAKYVFKFVMIAFQLLLSFVYAAIICSLCDKSFDIKVVAIILILAAFTLIFSTIMELFAHLTASTDKAGLCTMGVMLAIAFALMPLFEGRSFGEIIKSLTKSCDIFVAAAPAVMLCVFAIGFICTMLVSNFTGFQNTFAQWYLSAGNARNILDAYINIKSYKDTSEPEMALFAEEDGLLFLSYIHPLIVHSSMQNHECRKQLNISYLTPYY